MRLKNIPTLGALAVLIILFPFAIKSPYYLRVINFAGIFCIVSIGLSLLMGYAGQISMGQAGFFAIGAYASGILTAKFGVSAWIGILTGMSLSTLLAFVIGIPTLKLKGHYLAMATLGIGEIIHITLLADTEDLARLAGSVGKILGFSQETTGALLEPFRSLTGGPSGLGQIPSLGIGAWSVSTPREWFFLIWGIVFIAMALSLNLINSRIGRALRAIHGNEEAASAMGLDTSRLKLRVFMISAGMASLAGSLYAHYVTFISPETFSINQSILFVVMVAVGGMRDVWGALVGTIIMAILPESLRAFHDYDILIYGLILLVIMMFIPNGITGFINRLITSARTEKAK